MTDSPILFAEWKGKGFTKSPSAPCTPASSSPVIFASASKAKRLSISNRACISSTRGLRSFSSLRRSTEGSSWPSAFPATRAWRTLWLSVRPSNRLQASAFRRARLTCESFCSSWNDFTTTSRDVGAICTDTGFAIANVHALRLREDLLRLNDRLFGHRLLRGSLVPGGTARDLEASQIADARASIARIIADFDQIVDIASHNGLVLDRLHGTGRLNTQTAREMQAVGVAGAR